MKISKILKLSLSLLVLVGCEDDLDLTNPNNMTAVEYWSNDEQALAGINSAYTPLINDGYYMRMTPALTDGRADDFTGDTPGQI